MVRQLQQLYYFKSIANAQFEEIVPKRFSNHLNLLFSRTMCCSAFDNTQRFHILQINSLFVLNAFEPLCLCAPASLFLNAFISNAISNLLLIYYI
jgi:hypothetical protein